MDACHHYGQKQEGACQLYDPHKTEQEILAGIERERLFSSLLFSSTFMKPCVSTKGRKVNMWNSNHACKMISNFNINCRVNLPPCCALQWTLKLRLFYNGSVMLGGTCIIITYSASPLLCNQSPPSVMWQDFVWLLSVVSTGTWQALYQRAFLSDPQEFMHKHIGHNVPRKPDSLLRQ